MRSTKRFRQIAVPLFVGGAAITAIDLARRLFRHSQLFAPSHDPSRSWDPADYGVPPDSVEEHRFKTPDGETLYGWYCRSPRPVASALYCHGNRGNLTTSADVIPHLLAAGINVLFFDYRGFGRSSGIPSINGIVSDGLTAARFHDEIRPKSLPSILYGYSLGGAVAAQVIKRHPFDALILQSTFTSLPKITRALFPRIPLHLIAGNLFDTLSVVRDLKVPLLIIHGGSDEVVPCSMAHELYDSCPAPKTLEIIDGGMHKDLYLRDCDSIVWSINRFAAAIRGKAFALEPRVIASAAVSNESRRQKRSR